MSLLKEVGDNMKKKRIILLALIIFAMAIITKETYSYYIRNINVVASSTGSNIICDAIISEVTNNEKSIFGYSEFKVTVKNNKDNELSQNPFDYVITFENETGSDAIFGYNNEFDSDLSINGSLNNTANADDSYIIQVKSNNGLSESINYKVNVNCTQKN